MHIINYNITINNNYLNQDTITSIPLISYFIFE